MKENLGAEIAELRRQYKGLTSVWKTRISLVVSGVLPFEAWTDSHETIADTFEIDLIIPEAYPEALPWVMETSGRISDDYEHVYSNGRLCLAVPTEERLIFWREPCLRGFVTNLLIPYCYGYCYWERHGTHPFGEREHGGKGIASFYIERFGLEDEIQALEFVIHRYRHGYRGHHSCPCGSGLNLRNCHGSILWDLHRSTTAETAWFDLKTILAYCSKKAESGELEFPERARQRISRQLHRLAATSGSAKHLKKRR